MWVFYGLLPTFIVLFFIGGVIALLVRRGSEGWNIQFSGVLLAYVATAMLIGVFLVAAGAGLLLKAGLGQIGDRDFSYNVSQYTPYSWDAPSGASGESAGSIDRSDTAIRDDVATGISLTFAGGVLFAVHAFGALVLRRREAQGSRLIARAYNVVGLAVATIGFVGTGAEALNDMVRRYVVGGDVVDAWSVRHPGEPLATAVVLFPLLLWFAWRVWQEMGAGAAPDPARDGGGGTAPEGA